MNLRATRVAPKREFLFVPHLPLHRRKSKLWHRYGTVPAGASLPSHGRGRRFKPCTVHHRTSMKQGLTRKCKPFFFLLREKYGKSTENRCSVDLPATHSIANGSACWRAGEASSLSDFASTSLQQQTDCHAAAVHRRRHGCSTAVRCDLQYTYVLTRLLLCNASQ
jgi:hypothetical protein